MEKNEQKIKRQFRVIEEATAFVLSMLLKGSMFLTNISILHSYIFCPKHYNIIHHSLELIKIIKLKFVRLIQHHSSILIWVLIKFGSLFH
ncbi:hypothetical protein QVD17_00718 [Tagetes erecta]|uniref:Uncharacterized protein n=1 Tax=Tagetes erecta TaxID=13708 RepID=A0AAD8L8D4_TARER|nr:hypothetical protein QVD17_00718 [Tagetes erecta]